MKETFSRCRATADCRLVTPCARRCSVRGGADRLDRLRDRGFIRHPDGQWRPALDALRPHAARLWQQLAPDYQRTAVRRWGALWNVHRHWMGAGGRRADRRRAAGRSTGGAGGFEARRVGHRGESSHSSWCDEGPRGRAGSTPRSPSTAPSRSCAAPTALGRSCATSLRPVSPLPTRRVSGCRRRGPPDGA